MESALAIIVDVVTLGLSVIAILAAIAVGTGDVKFVRKPVTRLIFTPVLAVLALWILWHGIARIVSG